MFILPVAARQYCICFQVNGFLSIRYDFGSGVQELVEKGSRFNDGTYHRLSFQRIGTSYQLQVDDRPSQLYTLQGKMIADGQMTTR